MELRCPDCLSPKVGPRTDGAAEALRCENCGERFEREEAFVTVRDAEEDAEIPVVVPEELFILDGEGAGDELRGPGRPLSPIGPDAGPDDLHRLLYAAQSRDVIRAGRAGAWISICPLSLREPAPTVAVDPGDGPILLGHEHELAQYADEDPVAFTVRLLGEIVAEANSLAAGRAADGGRLDRITAFLNRPGQWNGGDVCEFVAKEIVAGGRRLLDADE